MESEHVDIFEILLHIDKSGKSSKDTSVPLPVVEGGNNNPRGQENSSAEEIMYVIEIGLNVSKYADHVS